MRIEGWKGKQVFDSLIAAAMVGANAVMDDHVKGAKALCPVGTVKRGGANQMKDVLFTTKRGKIVNFIADTWMERIPGSLKNSIRKVEKYDRAGNIRVYAGNKQVFYARFVEFGTAKTKRQSYMRPSWQAIKGTIKDRIETEMKKVPEVKA